MKDPHEMSSRTGNNCVNCQVSTGTECRHEYIITYQLQGIRKVPFPRKLHIQAQRRKKSSVSTTTNHNSQPAWWVSLPSPVETARRFFFFVDVHLQR